MEQLKGLSRAKQIILGASALLLIATFLPWQKWSSGDFGGFSVSVSWNAWHGFLGWMLGLFTIAMIVWILASAFRVDLPGNLPDGVTTLVLGAGILVFAVLKNLTDDYSAWASYLGMVLAAGVAYGAWMHFQESGEELPALSTSRGPQTAAATPAAGASAETPTPPAEPAAEDDAPPSSPPPA